MKKSLHIFFWRESHGIPGKIPIRKMWNLQIAMSKISSDRQMIILRRKEAKNPKESCQCRNNLKEYTREFEIKNVIVLSAYLNHSSIV